MSITVASASPKSGTDLATLVVLDGGTVLVPAVIRVWNKFAVVQRYSVHKWRNFEFHLSDDHHESQ